MLVAITIDWEGADIAPESLDALDALRTAVGTVPITHFVCAAYFTQPSPDPALVATLTAAVRHGDELATHLHAWKSLAEASHVTPRLAPSFLTGTDALLPFPHGDTGFDVDLDAYSVPDLRAMLRTTRALLESTHLPLGKAFRAGGYLGTPKVLEAAAAEGFAVDSSAIDVRQLADVHGGFLATRLAQLWKDVDPSRASRQRGLVELPITSVADYATTDQIVAALDHAAAVADRDVIVVLAFHEETAADFAPRIAQAVAHLRARADLADRVRFLTIDELAQAGYAGSR